MNRESRQHESNAALPPRGAAIHGPGLFLLFNGASMKFADLPATDKRGRPLQISNASIDSVSISNERCLSAWVHVRFDSGGCGFGGFVLGNPDGSNITPPLAPNYCAEFIARCLKVGGSETWEGLEGKPIRVLHEGLGGGIIAVGHFLKDEWFSPRVEWQ